MGDARPEHFGATDEEVRQSLSEDLAFMADQRRELVQLLKSTMQVLRNKAASHRDRNEQAARIQRELMERELWP